jgi:hypothetical protein
MLVGVFERFTDRARRVLVLAQEEARLLGHDFIGTEHILLGLIREGDGVAAKALEGLGIHLNGARHEVLNTVEPSGRASAGSPPFTPRAKKVLELSLREALQLGHNYIGTEHLLLGLIREGDGVALQVLDTLGVDVGRLRQQVVASLGGRPSPEAAEPGKVNADEFGQPAGVWRSYTSLTAPSGWRGVVARWTGVAPGPGLAGVMPAALILGVPALLWTLAVRGATRRSWRVSLSAALPLAAVDVATSAGVRRGLTPTVSAPRLLHHQTSPVLASAVCSFCSTETLDVVAGPGVFICWSCVADAAEVLAGRIVDDSPPRLAVVGSDQHGTPCSFCGKLPSLELSVVTASGQGGGGRICRECVELCGEIIARRRAD